jgi:hypothetical protein
LRGAAQPTDLHPAVVLLVGQVVTCQRGDGDTMTASHELVRE